MKTTINSKLGYGFIFDNSYVVPGNERTLWNLIRMAPKYAASLTALHNNQSLGCANNSPYELLEMLDADSPKLAYAKILQAVIAENEGIELVATVDFGDSDNIILAYPGSDAVLENKLKLIFSKYLSIYPQYVCWFEVEAPEREFYVETPVGRLKVYAAVADDATGKNPGVCIDLEDPVSKKLTSLSVVEYDRNFQRLQTYAYSGNDSPNALTVHVSNGFL